MYKSPQLTYFRPPLHQKNFNKLNFAVVMASLFTAETDMLGTYSLSDLAVESEP